MRKMVLGMAGLLAVGLVVQTARAQGLRSVGQGPSTTFLQNLPSGRFEYKASRGWGGTGGMAGRNVAPGGGYQTAPGSAISMQRTGWEPVSLNTLAPGIGPIMMTRVRSIDSMNFDKRARFSKLRETTLALEERVRETQDASLSQLSLGFRQFMFPFPLVDLPKVGYGFFSRTDLVGGGAVRSETFLAPFTPEVQQSLGEKRFLDMTQLLLAGRRLPPGLEIDQFYDTQLAALGNSLFNNARYDTAGAVWAILAERDPTNSTARRALGLSLVAARQFRRAAGELRRSLIAADGWPDHLQITGSNLRDVFPQAKDLDDLRAELDAQLAKQPDDPDLGFLVAFLDLFQGRWPDAQARLDALATGDEVAKTLLETLKGGRVLETVRRPVEGVLRRVAEELTGLEEEPLSPEARDQLVTALRSGPTTYEDYMRVGDFRFFMGDYTQAGESYRAAHKAKPEDAFALFALTHASFANGESRQAARYLDQALALEPNWGLYEFRLQEFYGDIGEYRRHLRDLQRQVELRPQAVDVKFLLAYVYYFSGRYSDATDLLAEVLRRDPSLAKAGYFLRLSRLQG